MDGGELFCVSVFRSVDQPNISDFPGKKNMNDMGTAACEAGERNVAKLVACQRV